MSSSLSIKKILKLEENWLLIANQHPNAWLIIDIVFIVLLWSGKKKKYQTSLILEQIKTS